MGGRADSVYEGSEIYQEVLFCGQTGGAGEIVVMG